MCSSEGHVRTNEAENIFSGTYWEMALWRKYAQRSPPSSWDPPTSLGSQGAPDWAVRDGKTRVCPGIVRWHDSPLRDAQPADTYSVKTARGNRGEQRCPSSPAIGASVLTAGKTTLMSLNENVSVKIAASLASRMTSVSDAFELCVANLDYNIQCGSPSPKSFKKKKKIGRVLFLS